MKQIKKPIKTIPRHVENYVVTGGKAEAKWRRIFLFYYFCFGGPYLGMLRDFSHFIFTICSGEQEVTCLNQASQIQTINSAHLVLC